MGERYLNFSFVVAVKSAICQENPQMFGILFNRRVRWDYLFTELQEGIYGDVLLYMLMLKLRASIDKSF